MPGAGTRRLAMGGRWRWREQITWSSFPPRHQPPATIVFAFPAWIWHPRRCMNHELITAWLKLPPDLWPPDHYCLLGLLPGEADVGRIEHEVHQRLEVVRRYQLTHPELATEAMNRLAQAFVCLSDARSKRLYDAELLGPQPAAPEPVPVAESAPAAIPEAQAVNESPNPLAWTLQPPPVRALPSQEGWGGPLP